VNSNGPDLPSWTKETPRSALSKDQRLLGSLIRCYEQSLERVHQQVLKRLRSSLIPSVDLRDLVYRHCLPFFAALDALNCELRDAERVACGAVLAYSIPLVLVDAQLDGQPSGLRRGESLWREVAKPGIVDLLTHRGYGDIAAGSGSCDAVRLTSKTSSAVIMAMRLEASRRGDLSQLYVDREFINAYWKSSTSRLNGSGVGRLMIGLASILADGEVTTGRNQVAMALGKMRQLEDELMDVVEDIRSGLVTLPTAYGLLGTQVSEQLEQLIRSLWSVPQVSGEARDARPEEDARLRELVMLGKGHQEIIRRAEKMLNRAIRTSVSCFPKPDPIKGLLMHRRYQMDIAVANRLSEPNPTLTVVNILAG
jgi:hypothetical protein